MNGALGTTVTGSDAREGLALDAETLCEAFQATVALRPHVVALRTWDGDVEVTWREYAQRVVRVAAGLQGLGVRRGETVALMLTNRPEFHFCDTAGLHLGATPFSIYNTSAPDQIAHMFANARNRVVVCERAFVGRVRAALAGTCVEHVICIDDALEGTLSLGELEAGGGEIDLHACARTVQPDDVLTLIYTSGTTGPPKGVEITHAGMLAMTRAWTSVMPTGPDDRVLSYLPAAHIVDRMTGHYLGMTHGVQLSCVADVGELAAALVAVRPTQLTSVPRVWEKLQAALESAIASDPNLTRRDATQAAIEVGRRKVAAEQAAIAGDGERPDPAMLEDYRRADETVLGELRAKIGLDQTRVCCAGAAPTARATLEFFGAIGLELCEGWGMSELSGVGSLNPPGRAKHGTVGQAVSCLDVRLADDGELLCRGTSTMRGYRDDPGRTAETIDADGWLHTGDIAEIDQDGYVRIVDRKKELIINAAGKNMSPANIEAHVKSASPLIGQAVAIGDRRPYNIALIVLDADYAPAWASQHGLENRSLQQLAGEPSVLAAVQEAIDAANSRLARVEQIKKFQIVPGDWLPGGEELTPTMKLKRKPIAQKYAAEIDALYA